MDKSEQSLTFFELPKHKLIKELNNVSKITCVTFSADYRWVATGGEDRIVRVWGLGKSRGFSRLSQPEDIRGLSISSDGRWLAVAADTTLRLWDFSNHRLTAELPMGLIPKYIAVAQGGRRVAVGIGFNVSVWELPSRRQVSQVQLPSVVNALSLSPDGKWLATK